MSNIPADLRYAASHEWARLENDGTVFVGISDHAQEALGDVVYVELPEVGAQLAAGQEAGVVESVKAASDIYAPLAGEVLAVNQALVDNPSWSIAIPMAAGSSSSSRVMSASWMRCSMPMATGLRLKPTPDSLLCAKP